MPNNPRTKYPVLTIPRHLKGEEMVLILRKFYEKLARDYRKKETEEAKRQKEIAEVEKIIKEGERVSGRETKANRVIGWP